MSARHISMEGDAIKQSDSLRTQPATSKVMDPKSWDTFTASLKLYEYITGKEELQKEIS